MNEPLAPAATGTTTWITAEIVAVSRNLVDQTGRAAIKTEEDAGRCGDLRKMIKQQIAIIEAKRKSYTDPLNKTLKAINADAKALSEPLARADVTLGRLLTDFLREKQRAEEARAAAARKEAEDRALAQAEVLAQGGFKEDADRVVTEAATAGAVVAQTARADVSRGTYGSTTGLRRVWKVRVLDVAQLPRRYLVADERLLAADLAEFRAEKSRQGSANGLKGKALDAFVDEQTRAWAVSGAETWVDETSVTR